MPWRALALSVLAGLTLLRVPAAGAQGQARELVISPRSASAADRWIRQAVAAMAARDFDAAVAAADSAEAVAPDRSAAQLVVGQAYLSHARDNPSLGAIGKVKKGRAAVGRAIALDPDNLEARTTLLQFLLQAPGIVGGSREGAREQAREIERRDRRRGLLARLDVAIAGGKEDELRAVYADAVPMLGTPGDGGVELARTLLGAARKVKDTGLRKELTARVMAAMPEEARASFKETG